MCRYVPTFAYIRTMKTKTRPSPVVKRGLSKDKMPDPAPYKDDARRKWLKDLLRAYGTNNRTFASMVDFDSSTFNLLTTGRRYITDLSVYRIVRKLGVPPPSGMAPPPPVIAKQQSDQTVAELNQRIAILTKQLADLEARPRPVTKKA